MWECPLSPVVLAGVIHSLTILKYIAISELLFYCGFHISIYKCLCPLRLFFFLYLSPILVSGNISSYKMRWEMFPLCFYSKFHPKLGIFELKVVCISLLHVSVCRSVMMSSCSLVSDWNFLSSSFFGNSCCFLWLVTFLVSILLIFFFKLIWSYLFLLSLVVGRKHVMD